MKIGIMQPYFFPYIGYWQLINAVDEYVIFDDVNYIKRGWINKNFILHEGNPKRINLHIKDASQNRLIKDTYLAETEQTKKELLMLIKQAYNRAPFYNDIYELIEIILRYPNLNLLQFLKNQIIVVCEYLGIKTKLLVSSEIEKDFELRGENKIIEICRQRNASCYVNAVGGRELYHQSEFDKNQMKLRFIRTQDINYRQFGDEFEPNLSIIDVMMFNSREEIQDILMKYQLEE